MSHTELSNVLLHGNVFELLGDHVNFLSLKLLGESLRHTEFGEAFLRKLSFRAHVDKRLKMLGIEPLTFWKAIQDSGAVIHGSFLLSCLLDPLSGKNCKIFTSESDIDILEPSGLKKKELCPCCMRKIYFSLFPSFEKVSMKDIETGLFGVNKNAKIEKKWNLLHSHAMKSKGNSNSIPHAFKKDISLNALDKYLCHQGHIVKDAKLNYTLMFASHLAWKLNIGRPECLFVDQCTISVRTKKELLLWIRDNIDFQFGKVAYDGETLTIFDLPSLLSLSSTFPDIEKTDKKELVKYQFSNAALSYEKNKRILKLWERAKMYTKRGFTIYVPEDQEKKIKEVIEHEERFRRGTFH